MARHASSDLDTTTSGSGQGPDTDSHQDGGPSQVRLDQVDKHGEKRNHEKSKEELIGELESLRERMAAMEQLENKNKESENTYRSLFEDSIDAIYMALKDGEIKDANWAILELFDYKKEDIVGVNIVELFVNHEDLVMVEEEIEKNGFIMNYEAQLRKHDGSIMDCLLTASSQRGKDGTIMGYQGIIRDITAQKRAQGRLWAEQEKRRNVVLNTCHLLHTPLTVVMGNLTLMKEGITKPNPILLDKLLKRLNDMVSLITHELYDNIDLMTVETSDGFTPAKKYDRNE